MLEGLKTKLLGEKISQKEYEDLFGKEKTFETKDEFESFAVGLSEYYEEMREEYAEIAKKEKQALMKNLAKQFPNEKLLTNVKIGQYKIDGILFTRKEIFLMSFFSTEYNILGSPYSSILKTSDEKEYINPLGQVFVWMDKIKKEKCFAKVDIYPLVFVKNLNHVSPEIYQNPYWHDIATLSRMLSWNKSMKYSPEQIKAIYDTFLTYQS